MGRPREAISIALLKACAELATPATAPTMREMADRAQVGYRAATRALHNMVQRGDLVVVGHRRVARRRSPVAEYAPDTAPAPTLSASPTAKLAATLSAWRPPIDK